jgi:hypothetical protein
VVVIVSHLRCFIRYSISMWFEQSPIKPFSELWRTGKIQNIFLWGQILQAQLYNRVPSSRWMKAHTVTNNQFTHTLDHAVNGNTLIFFWIFVFLYFWLLFNYHIDRASASNFLSDFHILKKFKIKSTYIFIVFKIKCWAIANPDFDKSYIFDRFSSRRSLGQNYVHSAYMPLAFERISWTSNMGD